MKTNYKCPNNHDNVVAAPDNSVLPMIMDCQISSCREIATLQPDVPEGLEPTHEWYIPTKRKGITKEDNRRYRKQGLYLKEIKQEQK